MGRTLPEIDDALAAWIHAQRIFFVASAPLAEDGHVNCSPKGGDTFRVLGPREVAYLDYTGSGAETAAHVRENGRLVVMFCAFDGAPRIVRLHGRGSLIGLGHPRYASLAALFPPNPGARAIVHIAVERVSSSCGMGVPLMDFRSARSELDVWAEKKGPAGLAEYRAQKNHRSIDGLPAFE
jgi:hypothetical protein